MSILLSYCKIYVLFGNIFVNNGFPAPVQQTMQYLGWKQPWKEGLCQKLQAEC